MFTLNELRFLRDLVEPLAKRHFIDQENDVITAALLVDLDDLVMKIEEADRAGSSKPIRIEISRTCSGGVYIGDLLNKDDAYEGLTVDSPPVSRSLD